MIGKLLGHGEGPPWRSQHMLVGAGIAAAIYFLLKAARGS